MLNFNVIKSFENIVLHVLIGVLLVFILVWVFLFEVVLLFADDSDKVFKVMIQI